MKNFFIILTTFLAIFKSVSIAPAEDGDKELRDIINKAIQAQGGAGQQAASKAMIVRGKGTWRRLGNMFEFTGEWAVQPPQRVRITIEAEMNGAKFKRITVLDGDRGWSCLNDGKAEALSPEEMAAAKAQLYAGWVASLTPLEDRAFSLTALSAAKVGSHPSVGIRVSRKDNPAVDLFFDKETGLLLKSEVSYRSACNGQEVTQSMHYLDYKEIGNIKYAMKRTVQRDEKRLMEVEYTDVQWRDKLDDRWFAKPQRRVTETPRTQRRKNKKRKKQTRRQKRRRRSITRAEAVPAPPVLPDHVPSFSSFLSFLLCVLCVFMVNGLVTRWYCVH